jgi:hypothetical protein
VPRSNGVVVFIKGSLLSDQTIFKEGTVFIDDRTMRDLWPFLEKRRLNQLVANTAFFSEYLREQYALFVHGRKLAINRVPEMCGKCGICRKNVKLKSNRKI